MQMILFNWLHAMQMVSYNQLCLQDNSLADHILKDLNMCTMCGCIHIQMVLKFYHVFLSTSTVIFSNVSSMHTFKSASRKIFNMDTWDLTNPQAKKSKRWDWEI